MFKSLVVCLVVHLLLEPLLPLPLAEARRQNRGKWRRIKKMTRAEKKRGPILPDLIPREEPLCRNSEVEKCPSWRKRGFCVHVGLRRTLEFYCRKECGYCVKPTVKPKVCESPLGFGCCWNGAFAADDRMTNCPACEDRMSSGFCLTMRRSCKSLSSQVFMSRQCPATCSVCKVEVATSRLAINHMNRKLIKG